MAARISRDQLAALTLIIAGLALLGTRLHARPIQSNEPIGGITFDPPQWANVRLSNQKLLRAELIGISPEFIHIRAVSGKEFHYELNDIHSIDLVASDFQYRSPTDTYRELVERARDRVGVSIDESVSIVGTSEALAVPPPPELPEMVDSPANYDLPDETEPEEEVASVSRRMSAPPPIPTTPPARVGPMQPFYETNAFKLGFLVACFAVMIVWWRNKVG